MEDSKLYIEDVDWARVPAYTRVYVWNEFPEFRSERFFAGIVNGSLYAYEEDDDTQFLSKWQHMALYHQEDLEKYRRS